MVVGFDEEDLLPAPVTVRDPAVEGTLWMYRIVDDGGTEWCPDDRWRLDVWRNWVWSTGEPGWCYGGRWPHRMYAEARMLSGAVETVHLWRAGLARAFHVDYHLESVEETGYGVVLVEKIRRHFWNTPSSFDGYVAA